MWRLLSQAINFHYSCCSSFNNTDINECNNNPCHASAQCINVDGSYSCLCHHGYSGDGVISCDFQDSSRGKKCWPASWSSVNCLTSWFISRQGFLVEWLHSLCQSVRGILECIAASLLYQYTWPYRHAFFYLISLADPCVDVGGSVSQSASASTTSGHYWPLLAMLIASLVINLVFLLIKMLSSSSSQSRGWNNSEEQSMAEKPDALRVSPEGFPFVGNDWLDYESNVDMISMQDNDSMLSSHPDLVIEPSYAMFQCRVDTAVGEYDYVEDHLDGSNSLIEGSARYQTMWYSGTLSMLPCLQLTISPIVSSPSQLFLSGRSFWVLLFFLSLTN